MLHGAEAERVKAREHLIKKIVVECLILLKGEHEEAKNLSNLKNPCDNFPPSTEVFPSVFTKLVFLVKTAEFYFPSGVFSFVENI